MNSRARSTKTRIETFSVLDCLFHWCEIREQDPLKQGLKQSAAATPKTAVPIREQDPLKQGLKRFREFLPKIPCG